MVKEQLYLRYIAPTERPRAIFAGIEIELPIVNLRREAADFEVVHDMTRSFAARFGFAADKEDDEGNPLSLTHIGTGDIFTFDCSYNTAEISLGKVSDLRHADARLSEYILHIQGFLQKRGHIAAGMGINPRRAYNRCVPIQNGRYRMLFRHLSSYEKYSNQKRFAPYPAFGMFVAASQVQLDVPPGRLLRILRLFNAIEPYKSVLFANSPLPEAGLLLSRDYLWANSMQGFNPLNVGAHDPVPDSVDGLLEYMLGADIYCTERGERYYNFAPLPLREFFARRKVDAEYFDGSGYRMEAITPVLEDLRYFRTFKFQDLTFRGTIEFRSVCSQPLRERLAPAAFHLGLIESLDELEALLAQNAPPLGQSLPPARLRERLNRETWPDAIDRAALRKTLLSILAVARGGLCARGKNEEVFLTPLYARAERLLSPAREYMGRLSAGEDGESLIMDYAALS
jgi:gamma-glutamylcysteine synthetase